jgi:hypothetical protein
MYLPADPLVVEGKLQKMRTLPVKDLPKEPKAIILHLVRKCVLAGKLSKGLGQGAAEEAVIKLIDEGRVRVVFEQGYFYFEVMNPEGTEWFRL